MFEVEDAIPSPNPPQHVWSKHVPVPVPTEDEETAEQASHECGGG
jgi:hypothetical protein